MISNEHARVLKIGPGSIIAGRFEIVERIGAGGMGIVYKGIDRSLNNQIVALKVLNPFLSQNEVILKRFMNEVLVARSLSHPNIIRIHDIGDTEDGFAYISMEFVDGKSLSEIIMPQGEDLSGEGNVVGFDDALSYLFQIMNGVAYAHEKGIIHRDLKPANVMIAKSGEVKLADFGTARILGEQTGLTQDGQSVGTPDYMAPEQIRGEEVDCRSDIYSLGIIAYQLVTGRRPFVADSPVAVAFKHINDPFPFFANEEMGIPKWFEGIIHKATAKKKEDRFSSAEQLAFAIAEQLPELSAYAKSSHVGLPTFHNVETEVNLRQSPQSKFTIGTKRSATWVVQSFEQTEGERKETKNTFFQITGIPWLMLLLGTSVAICVGIITFFLVRPAPEVRIAENDQNVPAPIVPATLSDTRDLLKQELLKPGTGVGKEIAAEVPKEEIQPTPEPTKISDESGKTNEKGSELASTSQPKPIKKVEEINQKLTPKPTTTPKPKVEKPIEQPKDKDLIATPAPEDDLQARFGRINKIGTDTVDVPDVINIKPKVPPKKKGELNLLGAHSEVYRGSLTIDGAVKRMSLELIVQGDRVTGLADIAGYETFEVSGGIYPRGVSFSLKNTVITFSLTGIKRDALLRGTFTSSGSSKIGKWEVSLAD